MNKDKQALVLIIFLIIVMISLFVVGFKFIFLELYSRNYDTKYAEEIYEKNKNTIFRISKLMVYSGAEAKDNSNNLQDFNISQYSDIAVYIDNHYDNKELTKENTIKELYIDNFKISPVKIGEKQSLFYKNPLNMGKFREYEYDRIKDKLEYDIIYKNDQNDEQYYNTPVFFTDCSNPISISYINDNIYTNYSVPKNSSMYYDGRILKDIKVNLKDITTRISFTIHLKNNLDEDFVCNFSSNINLENADGSIYSGYIVEINENYGKSYKFFKL